MSVRLRKLSLSSKAALARGRPWLMTFGAGIAARVPGAGLLATMPAYSPRLGVLATKLLTVYADNEAQGFPVHQAAIAVFDPATGEMLALVNGDLLTAARLLAGPRTPDRTTAERLLDSGATTVHLVERPATTSSTGLGDFELVPDEAISCGFQEAVRGVLSHHVVIRDGKIANYHPYPPTPWNGSVRDTYGTPGPYEDAVQNTPIFEENGPDTFKGIDIMRAVRRFDPCLPCGVHMYLGNGKVIETHHSPFFGR